MRGGIDKLKRTVAWKGKDTGGEKGKRGWGICRMIGFAVSLSKDW